MSAILVVDDQKGIRDVLRKVLIEVGHDVVEAEDGAAALALFRVQPFNLVITDIIMPEKEGIEIIATIKRERPDTKILAMSGGGRARMMDFLAVARKAGADATLEKPFRKNELLDRVAGLLGT